MADLFEQAEQFYQNNPPPQEKDPNYLSLARELNSIIESSPFLSESEKRRLRGMIGLMSVKMLEHLRVELLREGLTYHQNNPQDKKISRWLKLMMVPLQPKAVKK
jgi:hypothetical protein